MPSLRRHVVWLFVSCTVSCTAPVAAPIWAFWYRAHRDELKSLPTLHAALCKIGLIVGLSQTALIIVLAAVFAELRH